MRTRKVGLAPRIDIIVVNWNSGGQLRDCLKSIADINTEGFELHQIVVVDNASSDDSIRAIPCVKLPLKLICNSENRGFAVACNQGAKGSDADYLLFLNPDTKLFEDSLSRPIRFIEHLENEKVGICGIQLIDESGQVSRTCARFPTPATFFRKMLGLDRLMPSLFPGHFMTEWDHGQDRVVDQVMGAFFLVRRKLFDAMDGFDERFFVYFEEVDFSLRAYGAGFRSYYLAGVQIFHKGGGISEQVKATRLFYSLRSRILYGFKHFSWFAATGLAIATLMLEPVARLALAAYSGSGEDIRETFKGYTKLWGWIPSFVFARDTFCKE